MEAQQSQSFTMNWKLLDSLPNIGVAGAFAGVHNDVLIVTGGANFPNGMPWESGKKHYNNDIFVFKKNKNGGVKRMDIFFKLSENIAYGASVSMPKGIVCIGGDNENGISDKVFLMRWNVKNKEIEIEYLNKLPLPLTNCSATNIGNTLYVAGGESDNKTQNVFLSLDLNNRQNTWQTLPILPKPLSHFVMVAQNNSILVIGGRAKTPSGISDLYKTVFAFDVHKKEWIEKTPLPYPLSAGTGVALNNQNIILFGGDKGETFHQVETLLAAINAETNADKKQDLIRQKNALQIAHPGFSKAVLKYNTPKNEWKTFGTMPYPSPVTTSLAKWGQNIIIPSGEIRAGVRSPQLLSAKITEK